jgi:hypothetical protein
VCRDSAVYSGVFAKGPAPTPPLWEDPEQKYVHTTSVGGYGIVRVRRFWAEAMLDKYRGVPVSSEWASDPIVSRLKASHGASLHNEMLRFTSEAFEKRAKY